MSTIESPGADLFAPLEDLQEVSWQVDKAHGIEVGHQRREDENRLLKLDRFVGWAARLDPEALALRARVLKIIEAWLPSAAHAFTQAIFPRDVFQALGRAGALGCSVVGRDGQQPLSRRATCGVMHAIEYGDGGLRCAVTVHDSTIQAIERFGSAEQKARWLIPMINGDVVAAFALTEPGAGSDIRAVSTKAVRRGDDWLLTGQKSWITNGPCADVVLIWARTSERNDTIRGFLVEKGSVGLEVEPITSASAMRVSPVGRLRLTKLRVPHTSMLPHAWGLTDINACLDYNRLTVLFGVMGGARHCLENALNYASARHQFEVPIASKQLIQNALADMAEHVALGELASLHLAERWDQGALPRFDVSLIKRSNCAAALKVARLARSILGANGCDFEHHVMRHMLNLEASYSYGGTHDIHGLVIGKELTRENAF